MALVTVQRTSSLSGSESSSVSDSDFSEEEIQNEKRDEVPNMQSPVKTPKRLVRQGSVSENFFAVKGAALILPRQTSLATANLQIVKKFGAYPAVSTPCPRTLRQPKEESRCRSNSDNSLTRNDFAPLSVSPSRNLPTSTSSSTSSRNARMRRYDIALRVILGNHDSQFKMPKGELQVHLRAIFHHLRVQDNIKLAVRLESWNDEHRRYLAIISTSGRQDTDESIIIGCDFATRDSTTCTIGLVLPIWSDTNINLDGDGGFKVICHEKQHVFKPVSVQAMWSALQSLHRCVEVARRHHYYEGSLYLTWIGYYQSKIKSDRLHQNEWMYDDGIWSNRPNYFAETDQDRLPIESLIKNRLKQVMMTLDLDNCTSKDVRTALEQKIDLDLANYKQFIDTEMLAVLGQMDCPSKIFDYLYLGSEWNASNLEELEELGITHILNVTLEVDSFFPDDFVYKTVRLYDLESSDLLPHWNNTWKFINQAKKVDGKCLVHCKMGISRSAATVAAYLMKELQWKKKESLEFVKDCRSIIHPNPSFLRQLDEYEGILAASSQRHNKLFRSRSESSLSEPSLPDDHSTAGTPRFGAPVIHVCDENANDDAVVAGAHDFDLNRHLLDIASLSAKVSRPKSWSPDEGRRPYRPDTSEDHLPFSPSDQSSDLNGTRMHVSEPDELLVPRTDDGDRLKKAEEKRRNFADMRANLRRHTTTANTGLQLEELAHSEDSVFVHDGSDPLQNRFGLGASNVTKIPASRKGVARSSSPAALFCDKLDRSGLLDVSDDDQLHTSLVSPMNSPSYKTAKTVDVDKLKLRFSDGNLLPATSEEQTDVTSQSPCKASVPVKQIIAVIESPTTDDDKRLSCATAENQPNASTEKSTYTKGHQKTYSLPPADMAALQSVAIETEVEADGPTRSRSLSETHSFSVRKIVTAIESRNSPDATTGDVKTNSDAESLHRTMSMPSRRRVVSPVASSVSSNFFVPVAEAVMEADCESERSREQSTSSNSQFYIGDNADKAPESNANSNNNNNNSLSPTFPETLIISSGYYQPDDQPINSKSSPELEDFVDERSLSEKRTGPLSPEILQVIREVGLQLMSDSEESFSSASVSQYDVTQPLSPETPRGSAPSQKKRGIVRQMAREIEKRVRKLTGRSPRSSSAALQLTDSPVATPIVRQSSPTSVINSLLMGNAAPRERGDIGADISFVADKLQGQELSSETSPDSCVRKLVGKFDSPEVALSTSPGKTSLLDAALKSSCDVISVTPPRRGSAKDLLALVTATPYRAPDACMSSSPPAVSKIHFASPRVRRTQSERVAVRSAPRRFANYRSHISIEDGLSCATSQPELGSDCGDVVFQPAGDSLNTSHGKRTTSRLESKKVLDARLASSSPRAVRDMVRSIEETRSSSIVQRSSSMPSNSCRNKWRVTKTNSPVKICGSRRHRKSLVRSRSTPLLDLIRSGGAPTV